MSGEFGPGPGGDLKMETNESNDELTYDGVDEKINRLMKEFNIDEDYNKLSNPNSRDPKLNMREVYNEQAPGYYNLTTNAETMFRNNFTNEKKFAKLDFTPDELKKIEKNRTLSAFMCGRVRDWNARAEKTVVMGQSTRKEKVGPSSPEEAAFDRSFVKFVLGNPKFEHNLGMGIGNIYNTPEYQDYIKKLEINDIVSKGAEDYQNNTLGNRAELAYKAKILSNQGMIKPGEYKEVFTAKYR